MEPHPTRGGDSASRIGRIARRRHGRRLAPAVTLAGLLAMASPLLAATPNTIGGRAPLSVAPGRGLVGNLGRVASPVAAAARSQAVVSSREVPAYYRVAWDAPTSAHLERIAAAPSKPVAARAPVPAVAAATAPKPTTAQPAAKKTTPAATAMVLAGTNHFWFPALGVSDAIHQIDCAASSTIPGGIWQYGCLGTRNVYLLSHAWSDFKAVRTAYLAGTLVPGMTAYYAGADGSVVRYHVAWIRHVTLDYFNATYWQWALDDVDGVTLQTCDGASNQFRIVVRLLRG